MSQVTIDAMTSATGWTATNGTVLAVDWEELRAAFVQGQLQVLLDADGILTKTFSPAIVATNLDSFGFTISAIRGADKRMNVRIWNGPSSSIEFEIPLDFVFKTYEFYLPPVISVGITKIEFLTPDDLTDDLEFIITNLIAYRDDYPEDIIEGLKQTIEQYMPTLPIMGTATGTSGGSKTITLQGNCMYGEKFSPFTVNGETHQIESLNPVPPVGGGVGSWRIVLGQMFDGDTVVNAIPAGSTIRLAVPVITNPKHREGVTPCLSIEGGFDPEEAKDWTFNIEQEICHDVVVSPSLPNVYTKNIRGFYKFKPKLHGLFRSLETKAIIRKIMGQIQGNSQPCWTNGRKLIADFEAIEDVSFQEDRGETGELQMQIEIKAQEREWATETTPINTLATLASSPS